MSEETTKITRGFSTYGLYGPSLLVEHGFALEDPPVGRDGQFADPIDAYRKDRITFEAWGPGREVVKVPLSRGQVLELIQHLSCAVAEYDKSKRR